MATLTNSIPCIAMSSGPPSPHHPGPLQQLYRRDPSNTTAAIIALTATAAFFTLSCLSCWGFARWDRRQARRANLKQRNHGRERQGTGSVLILLVPVWTPPPTLPELPPMVAMEVTVREGSEGREREMERLPGYEEVAGASVTRRVDMDGEEGEEEGLPVYREREDGGGGGGGGGGADIDTAHVYAEFMTTTQSILQDHEVSTANLNQYLNGR